MKKKYLMPSLEIVDFKDPLMNLELPVSNTMVDDEAAKEQTEFEEEDVAPTSPNLWEDEED